MRLSLLVCVALCAAACAAPVAPEDRDFSDNVGTTSSALTTLSPLPTTSWHLDRIDQRNLPLNSSHAFTSDGTGVNIYVVGGRVLTTHVGFQGRATTVYTSPSLPDAGPCYGTSTLAAGAAAGSGYMSPTTWSPNYHKGVAHKASIKIVAVHNCEPPRYWPNRNNALIWLISNVQKPAVVVVVDEIEAGDLGAIGAVEQLAFAGIPVIVPAVQRVNNVHNLVMQVGTSTNGDGTSGVPSGASLLRAPGNGVASFWHTANDALMDPFTYSGAAAVATGTTAGAWARYLQTHPTATPAEIKTYFDDQATLIPDPGPSGFSWKLLYVPPTL